MKSLLRILLSVALAVLPLQAWAASGATTVSVFDSNGTARTVNVYSSTGAITGNLSWMNTICDFTTLTQCATVNSSNQLSTVEANSAAILSAVQGSIPAGAALIGKTGIDQTTDGTTNGVRQTTQYPAGAVAETVTATGTTSATTATLATNTGQTTYICGFSIRANATAAATAEATVTGVITATMDFLQWTAPLASGIGVTEEIFSPCLPASTTNTSIAVVSAAPGSGGTVSVSAWGYLK